MNRSVRTCMLPAVIVLSIVILCLSTSVGQDRKSYEVPAQIYGVPAWRSDAAHAVDAYERLMQRYTDLTERNMAGITTNLDALARKLDALDARLAALDARLARIEQLLGPASTSTVAPVSAGQTPPPPPEAAPIHRSADAPSAPVPPACIPSSAPGAVE